MIVAAVEEIDRGEMMTQEMVVAAAAAELEDWRRCENEADEQVLLEQLLQGSGMEENGGKQTTEKEQQERRDHCTIALLHSTSD